MNLLKELFCKEKQKEQIIEIPPMPKWETVVEMMYDKYLDAFADEVIRVIYSKDQTMRYVILKDEKGLFTYQLEAIYQFYEEEWKYTFTDDTTLPAIWEPQGSLGSSLFSDESELMQELKCEYEYKQYF